MNSNPSGSPLRSLFVGAGGLFRGLFPAAATFFSPNVSRGLVLRVSLLLFIRSLLEAIPLPLNAHVLNYTFSILSNIALSSVGMAAFAGYFGSSGWLGSLGRRLFQPAESPFIALYAALICLLGPLLSLVEAAVIVFSAMQLSRLLESHVIAASTPRERDTWRNIMLCVAGAVYLVCAVAGYTLYHLTGANLRLPVALGCICALYFGVAFMHDQGNVLDAALLTLYTAFLAFCAAVEERDVRNSVVLPLFSSQFAPPSPVMRAAVLVTTIVLALFALSQALPLLRVIVFGHDAVARQDAADAQAQQVAQAQVAQQVPANAFGVPALGLQAVGLAGVAAAPVAVQARGWRNGFIAAVAVAAVTFRTLVWTCELKSGEYLPAATRAVQAAATFVVFVSFLKIEGEDEREKESRQKEQATGKVD